MATRLGNEAAARAERDDNRRHIERPAEAVELVERERSQRFFGEAAAIHERDKLGFVGHEHIGEVEDAVVKVGAHRRGIEHRSAASDTRGAEHVAVEREVGLVLADDDAGVAEQRGGHIARGEGGIGAEADDDLIFPSAVDENGGVAGGEFFAGEVNRDAFGAQERFRIAAKMVVAEGADKRGVCAGAGRGDGLIGAFAAGAGCEVADNSLAGSGKFRAAPSEVLVEAADDDDGRSHRSEATGGSLGKTSYVPDNSPVSAVYAKVCAGNPQRVECARMEAAPMIDILFYAGLRRERAQRRRYVMAARLDPKFFFRASRGDLINPVWIDQLSR